MGGRLGAGFAQRLMPPVSNDTLLRVVRRRALPRTEPLTVVGIDNVLDPPLFVLAFSEADEEQIESPSDGIMVRVEGHDDALQLSGWYGTQRLRHQHVPLTFDLEDRVQLGDGVRRFVLGQQRHHDAGNEMREQLGLDVEHVAVTLARH